MPANFFHTIRIIFLLFATTAVVTAQQPVFHHLTVENGLSQNAVIAIGQDSRGFMWFGTSNGLNRYDGYRFKVYQSRANDSNSLTNNSLITILNDSKSNLWIGTYSGLNKYLAAQDQFKRIKSPGNKTLSYHSLYEDKKGRIWAGTNEGLFQINTQNNDALLAYPLPASPANTESLGVRAIMEDRNGNLWIGTTAGLFCIQDSGSHAVITNYRHRPQDEQSLSGDFITTLEEDRQGRIWVGTHINGLNRLDPQTGKFTRFLQKPAAGSIINNNIRKLLFDKEGRLWVGTQEGISLLDEQGNALFAIQQNDKFPASLSQNSVYSLFQDAVGNIWVGTYFGGVNYTYALNTQFSVLRKQDRPGYLNNNVISSIVEDSAKNLWIGTEGGGLNYYDRKTGIFTAYKHNPSQAGSIGSNLVKVVYRDWEGQIWCGTHGGGLNRFDPEKKEFRKYLFKENDAVLLNQEVLGICEDHKGRLWVGTTFGIKLFNKLPAGLEPVNNAFTRKAPFNATAHYIFEDEKQRLWLSTSEGLFLLEGETFHKISSDRTNCVQQDKQARIWIGVQQGGLALFNENSRSLDYYNQPGKIGQRNILGILEDEQQNLWLSSDKGLMKFNIKLDQLQLFTLSDGIAGNAFNNNSFFKDSEGQFYFGGFNGLTYFYPDKIQANQKTGALVLAGLTLFAQPIEPGDSSGLLKQNISSTKTITLKHNQDAIGIEFALLNYIKSGKNSYAYMLDGYDKEWIYTSTPQANYVNLPSGDFTFRVKGANNDGIWTEPILLRIQVLPPFWLSWWAFCLYGLAAGGIIFLVLRYFFLGALLKKEEELHQVKLNFFTNISHEIRTHLTLIMAPVERLLESEELNSFPKQQLKAVKQNANRLLQLVSELMEFRKAETDNLKLTVQQHDLIPLLEEVYNSFRDLTQNKQISTSFIYDGGPLPLFVDKVQLEKVMFNLMANAIKFTPENGQIWLQVTELDKEVRISVTDNGRGISPEYIDKLFTNFFQVADHGHQNTGYGIGLALSKNIISLHKGSITAESRIEKDTGNNRTCFTVTLLKGNRHFDPTALATASNRIENTRTKTETADASSRIYETETSPAGKTPSLLIVEDNPELRTLIRDTFGKHYLVQEAADGAKGLDIASNQLPDLIISDVMMPLMDGFELCRRLKTDPRTSHIPVILLTAKTTQSDQVSGLETGADMYLTKPFSIKVLELTVRNLLASREKLREALARQLSEYKTGPEEKLSVSNTIENEFLKNVIQIIEDNMDNPEFGVEMLSRKVAMSTPILYKKIKAVSKLSVNDFVKSLRLKKAAQLLREKQLTVYEVAYAVGYNDRKYFSQEFKKQFGQTPSEYAQG